MKLALKMLTVACAIAGAAQARADTVSFSGFANGSETVDIALSTPNVTKSETAQAGGLLLSLNGAPSFEAYCVDLYQTISFGTTYTDYSAAGSSHVFANASSSAQAYTDLGRLYARAGLVNNSVEEAAFQIAAWEIAFESSGVYNLAGGDARFTGGSADTSGALTLATTWLDSLGTSGLNVSVLESGTQQDMVFAAPVPEPSTTALMFIGMMGMGLATLRRRAKA